MNGELKITNSLIPCCMFRCKIAATMPAAGYLDFCPMCLIYIDCTATVWIIIVKIKEYF